MLIGNYDKSAKMTQRLFYHKRINISTDISCKQHKIARFAYE